MKYFYCQFARNMQQISKYKLDIKRQFRHGLRYVIVLTNKKPPAQNILKILGNYININSLSDKKSLMVSTGMHLKIEFPFPRTSCHIPTHQKYFE